jgi:hypothetical protein
VHGARAARTFRQVVLERGVAAGDLGEALDGACGEWGPAERRVARGIASR